MLLLQMLLSNVWINHFFFLLLDCFLIVFDTAGGFVLFSFAESEKFSACSKFALSTFINRQMDGEIERGLLVFSSGKLPARLNALGYDDPVASQQTVVAFAFGFGFIIQASVYCHCMLRFDGGTVRICYNTRYSFLCLVP